MRFLKRKPPRQIVCSDFLYDISFRIFRGIILYVIGSLLKFVRLWKKLLLRNPRWNSQKKKTFPLGPESITDIKNAIWPASVDRRSFGTLWFRSRCFRKDSLGFFFFYRRYYFIVKLFLLLKLLVRKCCKYVIGFRFVCFSRFLSCTYLHISQSDFYYLTISIHFHL